MFTYSFRSSLWGVRFILHSVKRLQFKNNATTLPCSRHVRDVKLYLLSPRPTLLSLMKHTWGKNNKTVKEYWKQRWRPKRRGISFKDVFWKFSLRWLPLTGSGHIQRKTKNPVFITILGLKDCGGFKGRQEMSRYQVVPFAISANFGCNLSAKVYAGENPYKNGDFLVGF